LVTATPSPNFSLTGRTALIAGASSGLGAGFARLFAAAGAKVVLGARRIDRVAALANELIAAGGEALAVKLDVTDEASVSAAYDAADAQFGTVHTIVCNAGIAVGGRSTDVPQSGVRSVMETNLLGTYLVAREGARRLIASGSRERGNGRIILIGSITAQQAGTGDAAYAATKAAIAHMGRQFAREWVRQGINVNTVQPGWIHTEINDAFYHTAEGEAQMMQLHRRRLQPRGSLDDMMLYLGSDRSVSVTGSVFTIDDGQSL
jgi:NAD(P)-dependent dehydrogenase (short-subunit alcohol dehydrogenase family)